MEREEMPMADRHLVDVHILLVRDDKLLLTQRRGDMFAGQWHLPSGKLDAGEPITTAAAREAREEIGVLIDPADLGFVHAVHAAGSGPEPRLGLFLQARRWIGEPVNREPDKCAAVRWFPIDDLPDNLIEYPAVGIRAFLDGRAPFSEHGWDIPHAVADIGV
ncbi:NUDIX domain-containing protein [Nocardia sp. NPDC019375]|uniref:NUDIX hydrolase n=1 Tax=Nocardia sp. NPDC019375 TaxID=3154685 RepID=UPI0033DE3126